MPKRVFAVYKHSEPVLRIRPAQRTDLGGQHVVTANEKFKETFGPRFRVGLFVAIAAHYAIITLFPALDRVELPVASGRLAAIDIPPRVSVPAPPRPVARPARPTLAAPAVASSLTIEPTTFDAFEPVIGSDLAPPPVPIAAEDGRPPYIPFEVAPTLKNRAAAAAMLERVYPSVLRDAGVSGSVQLWIYIDETGVVRESRVAESSGYEDLDLAATMVAYSMQFTPALMRDKAAAVWISQPITFIAK
ncbi:MAG: energy transducer TonB [Gemmatimonadota bacterium]